MRSRISAMTSASAEEDGRSRYGRLKSRIRQIMCHSTRICKWYLKFVSLFK